MNKDKYLGGKAASIMLGVHQRTLYQWDEKGWIETIRTGGGKRLYNVDKYLREQNNMININSNDVYDEIDKKTEKIKISYARVSTINQKDDMERQKKEIINLYPDHLMIEDIGSEINLNKRGIRKIIKLAIEGKIEELVIAHKDRLTRFGYELIEDIIKEYSGGKIIIINEKKEMKKEEELVYDVLQILNVYTAKMNGIRKYNKKKDEKDK